MKIRTINARGGAIAPAKAFGRDQAMFQLKATEYANSGVIITPGFLRLEVPLLGPTNQINFNVLDSQANRQVNENRLKFADTFTILSFAFYIGKTVKAGGAGVLPTNTESALMTLHSFPNPQVFTGGAAAANLQALYNSKLSLRIDTTTFIDSAPTREFYRVGTSQQQTGATNVPAVQADEWGLSMYGRKEFTPSIELNGTANIDLSVSLPTSVDLAAGANTYQNTAVLFCLGFLNQGAADTQKKLQQMLRSKGVKGISAADIGFTDFM